MSNSKQKTIEFSKSDSQDICYLCLPANLKIKLSSSSKTFYKKDTELNVKSNKKLVSSKPVARLLSRQ